MRFPVTVEQARAAVRRCGRRAAPESARAGPHLARSAEHAMMAARIAPNLRRELPREGQREAVRDWPVRSPITWDPWPGPESARSATGWHVHVVAMASQRAKRVMCPGAVQSFAQS